jgi:phospholipid/cholesterol/gamma-HCH transport system permease protein
MVAGRSASAFTAEIGSMKMREEIAAMRTIGIDPVETLVVPRVLALLVAMPLLTLVGDIMCLVGGAAVAVFYLDQSLATYLERLQAAAEPRHLVAGLIKTPFAALVIALVGCSEGLKVEGSAESLGLHVTRAVVKAIFLVIVLGALFAMFLVSAGI